MQNSDVEPVESASLYDSNDSIWSSRIFPIEIFYADNDRIIE